MSNSYIALLRGINVGGHNSLPMAGLRDLCAGLGWQDVRTYIQSGNIVFNAKGKQPDLESELEKAINQEFGLRIPVIVRSAKQWAGYVDQNPLPDDSDKEPNMVHLALAKSRPAAGAADRLQERAKDGERVLQAGDALWIHYPKGAGRSKLTPVLFDKLAGSPVTSRNWRTVLKLQEMVRE